MNDRFQTSNLLLDDDVANTDNSRNDRASVRSLDEVIEMTTAEIAAAFKTRKKKVLATVKEGA